MAQTEEQAADLVRSIVEEALKAHPEIDSCERMGGTFSLDVTTMRGWNLTVSFEDFVDYQDDDDEGDDEDEDDEDDEE